MCNLETISEMTAQISSTLITIIAIGIASASYISQINILILTQISEKAKEANSCIQNSRYQINSNDIIQIVNLLTAVITAIQLLDYNRNRKWYLKVFISRQMCLDQLILQLHPSIRVFFGKNKAKNAEQLNDIYNNQTIDQQFKDSCNNLQVSLEKYS